ncbi:predicted protein [Thalassiosira pseudonana CCMP1335]|jgi:hypothetical protein|uniref:Uncharacterized protein n=1 Tax=Thalassiosira pseudonana TaxID=35128 RepID=B8C5T1_THAPS|nr:predicted protein [Thalassiosira pseudonana CCMP1335]EED91177.1 predicted protein [Thalassiosira pseudonana CCMP1335]
MSHSADDEGWIPAPSHRRRNISNVSQPESTDAAVDSDDGGGDVVIYDPSSHQQQNQQQQVVVVPRPHRSPQEPFVLMLVGIPGSGKSVFAQKLEEVSVLVYTSCVVHGCATY